LFDGKKSITDKHKFFVIDFTFLISKNMLLEIRILKTVLKPTLVGWYFVPRRELMMLKELGKLAL